MKLLILQLARLGDIYQTWPAVRALRAQHPEAQIDILVRHRFRHALEGLNEVDRIWLLDSRTLLRPILEDDQNWKQSCQELDGLITDLQKSAYDRVINLSFSPMSSYLAHAIGTGEVSGYTRTSDGFLAIPDDGSAYVYAQVGVDRANRVHLCDLFAHICGVELKKEHWHTPVEGKDSGWGEYVVIHLGASETRKTYPIEKWTAVIRRLLREWTGQIVLIGSPEETSLSEQVLTLVEPDRILNLVGQTRLSDVFSLLSQARLLIGCDSGPMHIASLVQTPCLNLSFESVNFWETGPRAEHSRILYEANADLMASDRVSQEAMQMLKGERPLTPVTELAESSIVAYQMTDSEASRFEWNLTQALYMGGDLPQITSETVLTGLLKLIELNHLAIRELTQLAQGRGHAHTYDILDRVDETMQALSNVVAQIRPVIRWYQTEKIRLGPMSVEELVSATFEIHRKLDEFLHIFTGQEPQYPQEITHEISPG